MTKKTVETIEDDAPAPPANPHHILTEIDASLVSRVQARRPGGPIVANYSPISTMPELYRQIRDTFGPGVYELTGLDHNNHRLPSCVRMDIDADGGPGLVVKKGEGNVTSSSERMTDAAATLLQEQMRQLRDLESKVYADRKELEADRFAQSQKSMEIREKAATDAVGVVMAFLEKQTQAERELRQEQDRLRHEADLKERERERQAQEAQQRFELERQKAMAEVERARAAIEQQRIEALQQEMERKIEEERRFNALQIAQIQSQAAQEAALAKRMGELEVEQKKQELDRKYGFMGDENIPKSILEELWERRLDKEYPEESELEHIMRKYVEPIMALFQSGKIPLPGLPAGGNVPAQGALPAPAPTGNVQPGAVELGEYEDDAGEGEGDDGEVVLLPRGSFA